MVAIGSEAGSERPNGLASKSHSIERMFVNNVCKQCVNYRKIADLKTVAGGNVVVSWWSRNPRYAKTVNKDSKTLNDGASYIRQATTTPCLHTKIKTLLTVQLSLRMRPRG